MANSAVRQDNIVNDLRRSIVDGRYPPGTRLPTRLELEANFEASSVTIQRALDRLIADGFVCARGRQGTFVAEQPPCLSHYGIVFPHRPRDSRRWPRFWTALANEATALRRANQRNISLYYDIEGEEHSNSGDYQRLLDAVTGHRLAGLFFVVDPFRLEGTPILQQADLPRITTCERDLPPELSGIQLSMVSFFEKTLKYLAGRNRRRLAVVGASQVMNVYEKILPPLLKRHGMETHPYWLQGIDLDVAETARNCVHLLMHSNQKSRPDALLISDDNLLEHASGGLVSAGTRVPRDIDVVAHCNYPWPTPSVLPVKRVGFDARQVLDTALKLIDRQRRGESIPRLSVVEALMDDEVNHSN